jgi:hypothetical protein
MNPLPRTPEAPGPGPSHPAIAPPAETSAERALRLHATSHARNHRAGAVFPKR